MDFSFVDLDDKTIHGCKKNSWFWWHEKGHIEYNKSERVVRVKLMQQYLFWLWMFSLTMGMINRYMFFISLPLLLIIVGIDVYEEYWCNKFAERNFKK